MFKVLFIILIYPSLCLAGSCIPVDGVPAIGKVDLSDVINTSPSDDVIGHESNVNIENFVETKDVICNCNGGPESSELWDWTEFNVPTETVGDKQYGIINEYLSVAVLAGDNANKSYIPYSEHKHVAVKNQCGLVSSSGGGGFSAIVRLRKKIVGFVHFSGVLLYTKGVNTYQQDPDRAPEIKYFFSGNVMVPQSCELNEGDTISLDFGNIGAPLFSQAGAGNRPAGVIPKSRKIGIKCKNIDAQAMLSMRLEADKVSGNAMVSDNPDLGFIVAGIDSKPLIPNNIDSKIPFGLDDNASATVSVTAWPVSVTGNKPAEGKFTAEGYLRVDFD